MHHVERVCPCGYQVAVGSGIPSVVARMTPNSCPTCGHELVAPGVA